MVRQETMVVGLPIAAEDLAPVDLDSGEWFGLPIAGGKE